MFERFKNAETRATKISSRSDVLILALVALFWPSVSVSAGDGGDPLVAYDDFTAESLRIVSSAFLGLSIGCARCHDHRYDPISQEDYYRLRAVFEPGFVALRQRSPRDRFISLFTDADRERVKQIEAEAKKLDEAQQELLRPLFEEELAKIPEKDRSDAREAFTDTGDIPVAGTDHWTHGFLPSIYQGTVIQPQKPRILNLNAPPRLKGHVQERALAFLKRMNRRHLEQQPQKDDLQARIASYELAARMQLAAAEALDISQESQETQRMYGVDDPATREYAASCLLARRLIERGVRFVQVHTRSQYWDHHGKILSGLPEACQRTDKPAAALVQDLKQRGLLASTIVHWGGEMGRLPVIQNAGNRNAMGRDHNTFGFSTWLAGGGFHRGHIHGATDEFGHKAVESPVSHLDYLATILHLLGLDHERMVHRAAGREYHLMDGKECRIVSEVLKNPPQV